MLNDGFVQEHCTVTAITCQGYPAAALERAAQAVGQREALLAIFLGGRYRDLNAAACAFVHVLHTGTNCVFSSPGTVAMSPLRFTQGRL